MGKNINKALDATNKTLPKELGKSKQGLRNKKKDKKKKTEHMAQLIAKLRQDFPLTPSEISAVDEWLDEVRLQNAKRREINQREKERNSRENALFYIFWDHAVIKQLRMILMNLRTMYY